MDEDVARFLLMVLADTNLSIAGREVAALADLHTRAVAQVTKFLEVEPNGRNS